MTHPSFHPKAPKKLIRLWSQFPAYYRLAQYLGVNRATIWFALKEGKEPVNPDIREKIGLPRKPRKQYTKTNKERVRLPDYLRWWRELDPEMRNVYIQETYQEWVQKAPVNDADATRRISNS